MNNREKRRKICDSWYHQRWFRAILVIVGIDIFIFGFLLASGLDILSFLTEMGLIVKIIVGFLYILVASFVIHYAIDYENVRNRAHFTCHYCGYLNDGNDLDNEVDDFEDLEDLDELEELKEREEIED